MNQLTVRSTLYHFATGFCSSPPSPWSRDAPPVPHRGGPGARWGAAHWHDRRGHPVYGGATRSRRRRLSLCRLSTV